MLANQTPHPVQRPSSKHSNVSSGWPPAPSAQPITLPSPRSPQGATKPAAIDLLADIGSHPVTSSQSPAEKTTGNYGRFYLCNKFNFNDFIPTVKYCLSNNFFYYFLLCC